MSAQISLPISDDFVNDLLMSVREQMTTEMRSAELIAALHAIIWDKDIHAEHANHVNEVRRAVAEQSLDSIYADTIDLIIVVAGYESDVA